MHGGGGLVYSSTPKIAEICEICNNKKVRKFAIINFHSELANDAKKMEEMDDFIYKVCVWNPSDPKKDAMARKVPFPRKHTFWFPYVPNTVSPSSKLVH